MTRWEYDILQIVDVVRDLAVLNGMGDMGWELVAMDFHNGVAIFKRPKASCCQGDCCA